MSCSGNCDPGITGTGHGHCIVPAPMNRIRLALLLLIAAVAAAALLLDAERFLDLAYLQERYAEFDARVESHFALSSLAFFVLYTVLAALSVPGAALVCTLAAGALFGVVWGSFLVSFASSIGATLACLSSRFLLQDLIERKFPAALDK